MGPTLGGFRFEPSQPQVSKWTMPLLAVERLNWTDQLGGATQVGWTLSAFALTRALVQLGLRAGLVADRHESRALVIGTMLLTLGYFALSRVNTVSALIGATLALGTGAGIGGPMTASLIVRETAPDRRGLAFGSLQSISAIGALLGPAAIGIALQTFGSENAYLGAATILAAIALLLGF